MVNTNPIITGKHDPTMSGKNRPAIDKMSRPSIDAALDYLEITGYDILIVHALDRLARDPYIRQTLEREFNARGASVDYVLGNYEETPEGEVRKDLDKLHLHDTIFCDCDLAQELLLKKYGYRTGTRLYGHLIARQTLNHQQMVALGAKKRTLQPWEKLITDADVSMALIDKNVPLDPLNTDIGVQNYAQNRK